MAKVKCAVCGNKGKSRDLLFCSDDNLWVHYECADKGGLINSYRKCPNCGKKLSKK